MREKLASMVEHLA